MTDPSAAPIGSPGSNDLVRAQLASHGDDGTRPRDVEHVFRPGPETAARVRFGELSEVLAGKGYDVTALSGWDGGPDWLQAATCFEVQGEQFDAIKGWMVDLGKRVGWVYDGWSCTVLAPLAGELDAAQAGESRP